MRRFDNQVVDGSIFGCSDPITLPKFDQVNAYLSPDGQVQLDAVGQTANDAKWIVEVKWRTKRVGKKEMGRLLVHAQAESAQGWFISRAGFTEDALEYAKQQQLFCSDGQAIHLLHSLLNGGA